MYKVYYSVQAAKTLAKIPRSLADFIVKKIAVLAADPLSRNPQVKKLSGTEGYRLRVGDWRVVYIIKQQQLVISVIKIAPRGEVYK
jgi:mRNA interferase RelE/StbE